MKKCPRCGVLLLDTDSECSRCRAPVEVTISPEEARERRKKENQDFKKMRDRMDEETGTYMPPWAPPLVLIVAGALSGVFQALRLAKATEGSFDSTVAIGTGLAATATAVCVAIGLHQIEKREGEKKFESFLLISSLMLLAVSSLTLVLGFMPFVKAASTKAGLRVLVIFLALKASTEAGFGKMQVLVVFCCVFYLGAAWFAWQVFAGELASVVEGGVSPF